MAWKNLFKKPEKETKTYKAGDTVTIGDRQYELNDDIDRKSTRLNSSHTS